MKLSRSRKILNTRFFEEDGKRWMKSVKDLNYEILCVSQFTLYYKFKGNKMDFSKAMGGNELYCYFNHFLINSSIGEQAKEMYARLLESLGKDYDSSKIKDGVFGAMMDVQIHNDGPVTIEINSKKSDE